MICRTLAVALLVGRLLAFQPLSAAEPTVTEGRVSAVTVYQGQALVTREVEAPDAEGLLEVVVTNLPEHVLAGSLFAEPSDGVQIRSVRFRARPIEEDVRQEVRELDEQIQAVQDKLATGRRERALLEERKQYLNLLAQFSAVTSQVELKNGVLDAKTLMELTKFQFDQRAQIANGELELARQDRVHNETLALLNRKRETVAAGSARTAREAVVFINSPQAGAARLRLSYLVGNASWTPSYNLRADQSRDEITVEYNASIEQMSGEDWNDVEMTLSTATPSLVAQAPRLEVLTIKLGMPEIAKQQAMSPKANYKQVQESLAMLGRNRGGASLETSSPGRGVLAEQANLAAFAGSSGVGGWAFGDADTARVDEGLNRAACELQLLDFNNSLSDLKGERDAESKSAEGVSVSYQLANRTSLPSRADRQLIQIAAAPLKGDFYRLATPVLTNFVYEEARLTNTSERVFLAGPVATFLGGQFVGRGQLPTVAVGESFTVGLGIDSSLRAERELITKQERIQGGNRVVDFTYELSLENFGADAAKVRLLDRLPTAGDDGVKVTLVKGDQPVSDDESYQMTDRQAGILRWDVEVPGQAVGPKRKKLRYTMQIEYDKQLSIVGMPAKR